MSKRDSGPVSASAGMFRWRPCVRLVVFHETATCGRLPAIRCRDENLVPYLKNPHPQALGSLPFLPRPQA
jgi:hypothetical protein